MTQKTLYVTTDSLELNAARQSGWLRVIIGDSYDVDVRSASSSYKHSRKREFFGTWELPEGFRDYAIHDIVKRGVHNDIVWIDPDAENDVNSKEVFSIKVDPNSSDEEMMLSATYIINPIVESLGGNIVSREFIPTTWQRDVIRYVANELEQGSRTFMLELAARFGKTGTTLCMFKYSSADVMVVTNYVKTVNRSFAETVLSFFSDCMDYYDANSADLREKIDNSIANGRKVVVSCSLFRGRNLSNSIETIASYDSRIVVADEADFGLHRKGQVERVNALRNGVPLFLMTGTNSERAKSTHTIDSFKAVTYFDMLMQTNQ